MMLMRPFTRCVVLLWFVLVSVGTPADAVFAQTAVQSAQHDDFRQAVQGGVDLERSRQWHQAIEHYESALKNWPDNNELRYGLRRSRIHLGIERRYTDTSFVGSLSGVSRPAGMKLFDEVLRKVMDEYVSPVSSTSFVAHGTESFYLALANEDFLQRNAVRAPKVQIEKLRRTLRDDYWNKPVADISAAVGTVNQVCDLTQSLLGLSSGPVIMEYVFGGFNALDDYSSCLTPGRYNDMFDNIEGEFVGLGVEMKAEQGKGLLLVNVLPESPAAEVGLLPGDYIVSIDGADCLRMTTDAAAGLLRGPVGSHVRLGIQSPDSTTARLANLVRRPVHVKSIPVVRMIDERNKIGYIQMTGFQRGTPQELDDALRKLNSQGMRALIWDLRGNPGGLLPAACKVADRFISGGVLVSTRGRVRSQNYTYTARQADTWNVPLVLLVDGDSASASEIIAGAIRDHGRGTIVGRTTYGKWSVQTIIGAGQSMGLRLTTAKFYSPNGHNLSEVGVKPDIMIEAPTTRRTHYRGAAVLDDDADADLEAGLTVLRKQFTQR
jgi:carboxyl-terminal processing protease